VYPQPLKYEFSPLISAFGTSSVRGYGLGASVSTPTPTPSPTPTPTHTPTPTPTRTSTPTPTPTRTPCPSSFYGGYYYAYSEYEACEYYYYGNFYTDNCTGQLLLGSTVFTGFINNYDSTASYYSSGYFSFTYYCPTPTPTPTPVPLVLGNNYAAYGGRYTGDYSPGVYIIDSIEEAGLQWKTSRTYTSNADNFYDGYPNTYSNANSDHPAFQYAADFSKAGYTDWYISSPYELVDFLMTTANSGNTPNTFSNDYWASMEYLGSNQGGVAYNWIFGQARWSMAFKDSYRTARPIRKHYL
jgi:hypothetical protein